jgi:hypothetical protein
MKTTFDPILFQNMIAWIGGISVVRGITTKITNLFKKAHPGLKKVIGYAASILVSTTVTLLYLGLTGQLTVGLFGLYGLPMWLTASGIYDQVHTS